MNYKGLAKLKAKKVKNEAEWREVSADVDEAIMEIVTAAIKDFIGFEVVQAEDGLQGYEIVIATPQESVPVEKTLLVYRSLQATLRKALPDLEFEVHPPMAQGGRNSGSWHMAWIAHSSG